MLRVSASRHIILFIRDASIASLRKYDLLETRTSKPRVILLFCRDAMLASQHRVSASRHIDNKTTTLFLEEIK